MPRRRAFLVGISVYEDRAAEPLPFIPGDLKKLGQALDVAGYDVEMLGDSGEPVRQETLLVRLEDFIVNARNGDELLISLSGHGLHLNAKDYVVPSSAVMRFGRLATLLVPVDMGDWLEQTRAAQVAVLVDACREGIDMQVMGGLATASRWSTGKIRQVGNVRSAYIYACSKGQYGYYVPATEHQEGFSLFSRALSTVAGTGPKARTIGEVMSAVQTEIDGLRAEYGISGLQRPRLGGDLPADLDHMVLFGKDEGIQAAAPADEDEWVRAAESSELWNLVPDGNQPGLAEIKTAAVKLVRACRAARDEANSLLGPDPWSDEHLPGRILRWAEGLASSQGTDLTLSAAEAGLLVVSPFVREGMLAKATSHVVSGDPLSLVPAAAPHGIRAELEQAHQGYPRLTRRAGKLGDRAPAADEIAWWLLHRFLQQQPSSWHADFLDQPTGRESGRVQLAADTFSPLRLATLARCIQGDPIRLAAPPDPPLQNERSVGVGTAAEQPVRERLLGYLLAVAGRFGLDARVLPDIVVEHVGIADPVSLDDLHRTLRRAEWQPRAQHQRSLTVRCDHPAIDVVLHDHVRTTSELLASLHADAQEVASLLALTELPTIVTATGVGPAEVTGQPAYRSSGTRFSLSDQDVRELLMGEQLYGDPSLAIRELYQNALDACRYRGARIAYLRQKVGYQQEWSGKISFRQGIDGQGRPYVECEDNGIGMGERELAEVFAKAGKRFSDLPEFVEEKAQWELLSPPVKIYPNSQFGIGVLSYFMLADEIEVETCRMRRDGTAGDPLLVSIAGPGSLFRIRRLPASRPPGTRVRLWLNRTEVQSGSVKRHLSCTDVLRRILWVAEFDTISTDMSGQVTWPVGTLSPGAPIDSYNPLTASLPSAPKAAVIATRDPAIFFCQRKGALLSDGLWIGKQFGYAIVNLTGPLRPRLAVDRTKVLSFDEKLVESRLVSVSPVLLETPDWLSFTWLWELGDDHLAVLEALHRPLADAFPELPLQVGKPEKFPTARIGLFPPDARILQYVAQSRPEPLSSGPRPDYILNTLPDLVFSWRLGVLIRVGLCPPINGLEIGHGTVEYATPTLAGILKRMRGKLGRGEVLQSSVALGMTPADTARLLLDVGLSLAESAVPLPASLDDLDGEMLGTLGMGDPWKVTRSQLLTVRLAARLTPRAVAERLGKLGCTVPPPETLPDRLLSDAEIRIAGELPDDIGKNPAALTAASCRLGMPVAGLARRLAELGFSVPDPLTLTSDIATENDRVLVNSRLDQGLVSGRLSGTDVPAAHLAAASRKFGRPVAAVARRLGELGFRVPDLVTLTGDVATEDDVALVHSDFDPALSWGRLSGIDVPAAHLAAASRKFGRPVAAVARRLGELGFRVPDLVTLTGDVATEDDVALVHSDFDPALSWGRLSGIDVPAAHLAAASRKFGRPVADVARRLRELGFTMPDPSSLSDRIADETDAELAAAVEAEPGQVVSLAVLLARSASARLSPATTAQRLVSVGHAVVRFGDIPAEIRPLFGVGRTGSGGRGGCDPTESAPWWSQRPPRSAPSPFWTGETISFATILAESTRHGLAPRACAEQLGTCGYVTPEPDDLPERVLTSAELELARAVGLQQETGRADLLLVSHRQRSTPADLARRLDQLGIRSPAVGTVDWPLSRLDVDLLLRRPPDDVPRGWTIAAAAALGKQARLVAARLRALGFLADETLPLTLTAAHRAILEAIGLDRLADLPVKVSHSRFCEAFLHSSVSPSALSEILRTLGFDAPTASADSVLANDAELLTSDFGECLHSGLATLDPGHEQHRWSFSYELNEVGWDERVMDREHIPIPVIIGASKLTGRSSHRIAERLRALGFDTADPTSLTTKEISEDQRVLVRAVRSSADEGWGLLLTVAASAGWDLMLAARRLYDYGYQLPPGVRLIPGS